MKPLPQPSGILYLPIPDKGQVMVRCGSEEAPYKLVIIKEEVREVSRRGWADMIRNVYEVEPLACPSG